MIIEVSDIKDSRLTPYSRLTDHQLRNILEPDKGIIIVESPKVISTALDAGCIPISLLCERRHIDGDAANIIGRLGEEVPVYTAGREALASLTGYTLTRGVLSAMRRPPVLCAEEVCAGASRIGVIVDVCDTTNIGSIFRSAAALGLDGILLTRGSCDPYNRRSIRVSMGTVFQAAWGWIDSPEELKVLGFQTAAMALRDNSISIDDERLKRVDRLAMMLGTEGEGLPPEIIDQADWIVKIPMFNGVDSLNVGSAAAITFWELRKLSAYSTRILRNSSE